METHIFQLVIKKPVTGEKVGEFFLRDYAKSDASIPWVACRGQHLSRNDSTAYSETQQEVTHLINWPMNKSYF